MSAETYANVATEPDHSTTTEETPAQDRHLRVTSASEFERRVATGPMPGGSWRERMFVLLIGADIVAITLGLALIPGAFASATIAMYAAIGLSLQMWGAYRARLTLSLLDDLPLIVGAVVVGEVAQIALRAVVTGSSPTLFGVARSMITLIVALTVFRAVSYAIVREARRRKLVEHPALILGTGVVGQQLADAMLAHPEFGLTPVGFLGDVPRDGIESLSVPLLGGYDDLAATIRHEGVSEVLVAFGAPSPDGSGNDANLVQTVRECDRLDCEIFCVPRFFELHHRSRDMDELWGISLVRVRRATWRSRTWRIKRLFDLFVAGSMLTVLAPLMVVIALAVRIENGPGVLFRQVRVGLDGHPFTLLKFRSVRPSDLGMTDEQPRWSVNGDMRLGKISRILRAASLDELPQLLNVLRGEMSIVGPRPEREHFVAEFTKVIPRYTERHRAPAGLTGWAQVNGLRGDTSIEERARFDNYYIQNWSLWLDLKIIARTVSTVLLRRGS